MDLQEKCREIGQEAFKADSQVYGAGNLDQPQYGYNKKLNTCIYSSGYRFEGNPSKGVSNDSFLKHNCDAYWEQWVKNSYTNERIIQVYNSVDNKCEWTTPTERIVKFQEDRDELFNQL